ncbi:hypothetical protein [Oceanobacillus chungangensis]|uniref:DUF3592 domain-containing protein n=1 Tax=Oceanobacillus chungangensis TaxID=1229152 RepID=A0A3D8PKN5_9BACI|nr:hypothetical protein [Oceanobacillus chungangensis]RDW16666.1 hypothetical protein CWR45_13620 [Oceanobacillus chungangensis]
METLKRIGLYIIGIFVFIMFVNGFIDESKALYALIQQQKGEKHAETVQSKAAENDLFGNLTYYAVFKDGNDTNVIYKNNPRTYAKLSKSEFEELEAGDKLEGTLVGAAFSNGDIRSQIYQHLIMMGIALIYPILFILYQLVHIPAVERWTDRHDKWLSRLISGIFISGLCIGLLFSYISMAKSIGSTIQAHTGKQQEAMAIITDRDADYSYKRYERDYYYLALAFEDQEGKTINLTKEVPPSVYHNNNFSVKISYPEGVPYRIHFDSFKVSDTFFYLSAMLIYILTIVLTILLIYAAYLMRRKQKTGSYWPEKKQA